MLYKPLNTKGLFSTGGKLLVLLLINFLNELNHSVKQPIQLFA